MVWPVDRSSGIRRIRGRLRDPGRLHSCRRGSPRFLWLARLASELGAICSSACIASAGAEANAQTSSAKAAPKPKARARRPWADVRQKLKFRIDSGKRVAPVKDAILEVDKNADVSHLGRDMEGWKKRFPNGEAFKAQRVTCKGGSKEWVATDSFLKGICGCE